MFLQETHCKDASQPIFNSKWFSTQLAAAGSSKSRGVAILLSTRLRFTIEAVRRDDRGRYLFVNIILEGKPLTLASLYAPNDKPVQFVADTLAELKAFGRGPILLGGDLNCVMDAQLDYSGRRKTRSRSENTGCPDGGLDSLLVAHGLVDLWRSHHLTERDFTTPIRG